MKQGLLHNLNNLLSGIEITIAKGLVSDDPRAALEKLQLLSQESRNLVREIYPHYNSPLSSSRLVDLVGELDRAVEQARLIFPDAPIEVVRDYRETPQVWGKPVHFQQIFLNLIINAFEAMTTAPALQQMGQSGPGYSPSTGHSSSHDVLRLEVYRDNHQVHLSISDTGPGISRFQQQRVFLPYYSTKSSSTSAGSGQGIGLWVVRQITESYGGQIGLDSEPGRGTTFNLSLPMESPLLPPPPPVEKKGFQVEVKQKKQKILLVDDDNVIRETLQDLLTREGMEVVTAVDYREMEEMIRRHHPFDLLMTDVFMPHLDSWNLPSPGRTKVIAMSGEDPRELENHPLLQRADLFLRKPFTIREILSGIENLYSESEMDKEVDMDEKKDQNPRDKRAHPRVSSINLVSVMQVSPDVLEEYGQLGSTVNLSQGGILFESKYPYPLQARVKITLEINDGLLDVVGRVIRLEEVDEDRISVAVRFVDIDENTRQQIADYLSQKDDDSPNNSEGKGIQPHDS